MVDVKVSVVIPIYNVASYIVRCLDSAFGQTYGNIEIILVDDCGSDNSMQIVNEYVSRQYRNYKILSHQHNRGLSAARNTGLKVATGDYVYFFDSDDEITLDCIESLVKPLENEHYDFVLADYLPIGNAREYSPLLMPDESVSRKEEILHTYALGLWYVMAWNKLCRRSFLIDNKLFFEEGLLHEDVIWTFKLACKAQSMFVIQKQTYLYSIRESSIMTGMSIEKDINIYLAAFQEIGRFLKEEGGIYGTDEYMILEGKKSTLLFSLLQNGNICLYNKYYAEIYKLCYVSPIKAFFHKSIGLKFLLRDFHYCLPLAMGRIYKKYFYLIFYKWKRQKIQGAIW